MKPRILIVEDEAIVGKCLKMDLLARGYEVLPIATTADKAVELTEKHEPDIILMDIVLKGKRTGIDAAREIGETQSIPIFFLTGNTHLLDDIQWVQKAMCRIISKPVVIEQLHQFIEETLGMWYQ